MGKNKNKQKELVNDLDIKNIGQVKAESVESTVDNSIEKDNKIKELEKEIKKLNGFEEEYKRLKSLEIAAEELKKKEENLNSRESQIKILEEKLKDKERNLQTQRKELEGSLEKDRNFLEVEIKRVDSLEKK